MIYQTRLKEMRKIHKVSQAKLAEVLQIPQQQYFRYESGTNELPIRYLIEICIALNVSADYLLGLSDVKERR